MNETHGTGTSSVPGVNKTRGVDFTPKTYVVGIRQIELMSSPDSEDISNVPGVNNTPNVPGVNKTHGTDFTPRKQLVFKGCMETNSHLERIRCGQNTSK